MAVKFDLNPEVNAALMNLMALIKPYHDGYFVYAQVAQIMELKSFKRYIRKRSHEKGEQWKAILFYLNDFDGPINIPPTPAYAASNIGVTDILSAMLAAESEIRLAIEDVMFIANSVREFRTYEFLEDMMKDQIHHEFKLRRAMTLFEEYRGDLYEWEKRMF